MGLVLPLYRVRVCLDAQEAGKNRGSIPYGAVPVGSGAGGTLLVLRRRGVAFEHVKDQTARASVLYDELDANAQSDERGLA